MSFMQFYINTKTLIIERTTPENIKLLLKQPSTIRGVIMLLGLAGYNISPEHIDSIIQTAVGAIGIYEMIRDGNKKP